MSVSGAPQRPGNTGYGLERGGGVHTASAEVIDLMARRVRRSWGIATGVAVAVAVAACGSSSSNGAITVDAAAEAAPPIAFTSCHDAPPAGFTPPKLPTYAGTCPTLALTPGDAGADGVPPENDIMSLSLIHIFGLGSSVSYHADFLAQAFARVRKSKPRVLVSGAADHAILAHVFAACDANAIDCEVTVIDRCETPLRVNVWYAARAGRSIATCRTDVFEHASTCLLYTSRCV